MSYGFCSSKFDSVNGTRVKPLVGLATQKLNISSEPTRTNMTSRNVQELFIFLLYYLTLFSVVGTLKLQAFRYSGYDYFLGLDKHRYLFYWFGLMFLVQLTWEYDYDQTAH